MVASQKAKGRLGRLTLTGTGIAKAEGRYYIGPISFLANEVKASHFPLDIRAS